MSKIHPTAIVEDGAVLGADVEIGPYAHVGPNVKLGDGTIVKQGAPEVVFDSPEFEQVFYARGGRA